jgi:hypothetical protein
MFDTLDPDYGHLNLKAAKAKSTNARWTLQTLQPVVLSRCTFGPSDAKDVYYFPDNGSQILLPNATELYKPLLDEYESTDKNKKYEVPPAWIASPGDSKSLLALYIIPNDTTSYQ